MDYVQIVKYLYPTAIFGTDFNLYFAPGSTTPTLLNWNSTKLGAQPTVAILQQAWPSVLLQQAQTTQLATLQTAYQAAAYTPVSYMSTTFPCTANAIHLMQGALLQGSTPQGLPSSFNWYDVSGSGVAMTLTQLQSLANLFFGQINGAYQTLQSLTAQVNAATTTAAVQAITWPTSGATGATGATGSTGATGATGS
jgi:Domain of unknown function (DUF4376)